MKAHASTMHWEHSLSHLLHSLFSVLSGRKPHISEGISLHLLFFTTASSLSPSYFPLPTLSLFTFLFSSFSPSPGPIIPHSLYFYPLNSSHSDHHHFSHCRYQLMLSESLILLKELSGKKELANIVVFIAWCKSKAYLLLPMDHICKLAI